MPGVGNVLDQAGHFLQGFQVVLCIDVEQPAGDVTVEIVKVVGQLAPTLEIQCTLQTDHNASGS